MAEQIPLAEIPDRPDLYPGGMKKCSKCKRTKSIEDFPLVSAQKHLGLRKSWCKQCSNEAYKNNRIRWRQENPEEFKRLERERRRRFFANNPGARLKHHLMRFGISLEEYQEKLEGQNGLCAICQQECSTGSRLSVDHDHDTGEFRGLLCRLCNAGIGQLQHDPVRLRAAITYLEG